MKVFKSKYLILLAGLLILGQSCSDSDKVVDQITDNVTRGAVLRQLNVISNSVAINSATNELEDGEQFAVEVEYQDDENGDLLQELQVFVGFIDNSDDGVDNNKAEVLAETVPASEFGTSSRGLPSLMYSISAQEMQNVLGLAGSDIGFGGDQFTVRFEIVLTDGRTFSNDDNSGTITGSYFNSPFLNRVTVVCAPSVPTAGTWTVVTTDLWGDGWNGGMLTVLLDGTNTETIVNVDGGVPGPVETTQTYTFEVPDGTQTISIMYSSGAFDEEVLWTITSANGNVVSDEGPNPPVGSELLDYCPDNL